MCTLILIRNVLPGYPLVVAANRDERLDRPSVPPQLVNRDPAVYAPLDLEALGTWIGVSERGVFAGITNRHDVKTRPDRSSRGGLVIRALLARDAKSAMKRIMEDEAKRFNGFQLLVADRRDAYIVRGDGKRFELVTVAPSDRLVILTDSGTLPDKTARAKWIRENVRMHDRHHGSTPRTLGRLLSHHSYVDHRSDVCVHGPDGTYGTRSSTIVRMDEAETAFDVWHREGRACDGRFGEPYRLTIAR